MSGAFDPVHPRHSNVHQNDIGTGSGDAFQSFFSGAVSINELHARCLIEGVPRKKVVVFVVIHDHDPLPFDVHRDLGRSDDGPGSYRLEVVAIERDVQRAAGHLPFLTLGDAGYDSRRELDAAALNSDDDEIVGPVVETATDAVPGDTLAGAELAERTRTAVNRLLADARRPS